MAENISYDRIYQAYSGCDMVAHIGNKACGTLQALTVSITREVVPVYTMGSADVKTFVKGKRGIAGTLSFSTFDRHALLFDVFSTSSSSSSGSLYGETMMNWISSSSVLYTDITGSTAVGERSTTDLTNNTTQITSKGLGTATDMANAEAVIRDITSRKLQYCDQIPSFDITLTMVNESGSASYMALHGVTLINEGYGYTMDDLTSETSFTYVARQVTPLKNLSDYFGTRSTSTASFKKV